MGLFGKESVRKQIMDYIVDLVTEDCQVSEYQFGTIMALKGLYKQRAIIDAAISLLHTYSENPTSSITNLRYQQLLQEYDSLSALINKDESKQFVKQKNWESNLYDNAYGSLQNAQQTALDNIYAQQAQASMYNGGCYGGLSGLAGGSAGSGWQQGNQLGIQGIQGVPEYTTYTMPGLVQAASKWGESYQQPNKYEDYLKVTDVVLPSQYAGQSMYIPPEYVEAVQAILNGQTVTVKTVEMAPVEIHKRRRFKE